MAQIALNYSAAQINAAIAKINSLVSVIEENIVQLYNGTTAIYPRTKAEAVFFDNDVTKTLDLELNKLTQTSKQDNVTNKYYTFVPQCAAHYLHLDNDNLIIIKTPYKFSDNKAYFFEIAVRNVSPSITGGGYRTVILDFWGRSNNTFDCANPYFWSDKNDTPVRLCTDSDGYISIVLGSDTKRLRDLIGSNATFYIKKVGIFAFGALLTPIETGYSISSAYSPLNGYSNIYNLINGNSNSDSELERKQNNIDGKVTTFVPQCSTNRVDNLTKSVYVVKTPFKFSDSFNVAIEMGVRTFSVGFIGYKLLQVSFWARNNNTFNSYTPKFQWSDNNDCPIRLCTDNEGFICIALGRDNQRISTFIGANLTLYVKKVNIQNILNENLSFLYDDEGWTITDLDELTSDYSNVYHADAYKTATEEYVDNAIENISLPQQIQMPIKPKSFSLFGSSKTTSRYSYSGWWSYLLKGLLMNANYTDSVTAFGTITNRPSNGKTFTNEATVGKKIIGVGSSMEFYVYGSHVDIVQMIERTTDYAEFDIYNGTTKIGSYNNINKTMLGTKTQIFAGTGSQKSFVLDHLDSYNFIVTVNDVSKTVSMSPTLTDDVDCFAVRCIMTFAPYNDGEPRRILYFPTAPADGAVISVTYSVGHVIGFTQSDYNELNSGANENTNPVSILNLNSNATYRDGYPLSPVINNPNAVIRVSFNGYALHHIKIVLTGGINPYFDFDFACAELNNFMNAAFGGYDIPSVINQSEWHDWRCIRYLPNFDALFLEYGTNDDRYEIDRVFVSEETYTLAQLKEVKMKDVVYITNNNNTSFVTGLCTGTIEEINGFSITSNDIKNSDIAVGDYVKIGEYHSDWREFTVRKVKSVDKTNGIVTWDKPFRAKQIWHYNDYTDMVGAQFSVRRLGEFKTNYSTICEKFATTNPTAQLFIIGMSAFNNNGYCSGWGYNEAQQDIVNRYHGIFINITNEQVRFNDGGLDSIDAVKIDIISISSADYEVAASSIGNLNRAMRVLVNGQDVTGIDAYVEITDGWHVSDNVDASIIGLTTSDVWRKVTTFSTNYNNEKPVKIHFYKNIPTSHDTIQLLVGGYGWSDDGIHQENRGNQTYGSCVLKAITQ